MSNMQAPGVHQSDNSDHIFKKLAISEGLPLSDGGHAAVATEDDDRDPTKQMKKTIDLPRILLGLALLAVRDLL